MKIFTLQCPFTADNSLELQHGGRKYNEVYVWHLKKPLWGTQYVLLYSWHCGVKYSPVFIYEIINNKENLTFFLVVMVTCTNVPVVSLSNLFLIPLYMAERESLLRWKDTQRPMLCMCFSALNFQTASSIARNTHRMKFLQGEQQSVQPRKGQLSLCLYIVHGDYK
jgi:hypothetical protein